MEKGQAFLALGNYEKARVEFRNALQIAPNDSEARFENGVVDEKLGNPQEAVRFYQGAIDANADNVPARVRMSRLYLFSGAPDRALDIIKPALERHPDNADALTIRAAALTQKKDGAGALADAKKAYSIAPSNEDTVAVLSGIYAAGGDAGRARELLESGIAHIPASSDLRLALSQLYASQHRQDKVEEILVELVRLQPTVKAHRLRLAQFYARADQLDAAERVLRDALKTMPQDRDLRAGLIQFLESRRGREAAEQELAALIAANPKDFELKFIQAQVYEQARELPKAEAVYRRVIDDEGLSPGGITARDHLAAMRVQADDVAGAQKLIAEVLAKNPRDNDALILRGNLALAKRDAKSAIADLRAVLRDQPNAVGVLRTLARAHLANAEPALAEETMRRAVDANPNDPGARLDLATLLMQLGKPDQAKPVIAELVKQRPADMAALEAQYRIAALSKDGAMARAAAEAMIATQPKTALGYYFLGLQYHAEERLDDALKSYSQALALEPEAVQPLQAKVRVLVQMKRAGEALKLLDAQEAQFPKAPFASNLKGELLLGMQKTAEAESAFRTAINRTPSWWVPYQGLALEQLGKKESDAALGTLRDGLARSGEPEPLATQLAMLFEQTGRPADAQREYESILSKNPGNDIAANNLAMLLVSQSADRNRLDRAKQLTTRFAAASNPSYLDTYGWVLFKSGDSAAAVAVFEKVLGFSPQSATAHFHLGMAQAQVGQADAARVNLAAALRSGEPFQGADEAKAALNKLPHAPPPAPQS